MKWSVLSGRVRGGRRRLSGSLRDDKLWETPTLELLSTKQKLRIVLRFGVYAATQRFDMWQITKLCETTRAELPDGPLLQTDTSSYDHNHSGFAPLSSSSPRLLQLYFHCTINSTSQSKSYNSKQAKRLLWPIKIKNDTNCAQRCIKLQINTVGSSSDSAGFLNHHSL